MQTKISKHAAYRARVKARAIEMRNGCCSRCGFDDVRALTFYHTKPVRRGRSGLRKQARSSTESHLAIVRGDGKGLTLLCWNCVALMGARDTSINANITRAETR